MCDRLAPAVNPAVDKVRPARPAGFTLIELLVVLAIMAVLTAGLPAVMAGIPSVRLRAAAAAVADQLRLARDDALRTGRPAHVMVRGGPASLTPATPDDLRLPSEIDVEAATLGFVATDGRTRFRFFPDGSASGGTIRLRQGRRTAVIAIDWLTGRVRVDG